MGRPVADTSHLQHQTPVATALTSSTAAKTDTAVSRDGHGTTEKC